MTNPYRFLAVSDHPLARAARAARRSVVAFSLPAPRLVYVPVLWCFLGLRTVYHFLFRVLVCEPIFKAYCTRYGRGLHTDVHLPWIEGRGEIFVGNHVLFDGKCVISFAARFTSRPLLEIGDHTCIGHNCAFTVGKRITVGRHCHIASDVWLFDSSGHPTDPAERLSGAPPAADEVRPITIGDNVWIGRRAIVFPGVSIGEGSVVSAGAAVMSDVPPNAVVAGNPARKIASLERPVEKQPVAATVA